MATESENQMREALQRVHDAVLTGIMKRKAKERKAQFGIMERIYKRIRRYNDPFIQSICLAWMARIDKPMSDCELFSYCSALCGLDKEFVWEFMHTHIFLGNFFQLEERCSNIFDETPIEKGFHNNFL